MTAIVNALPPPSTNVVYDHNIHAMALDLGSIVGFDWDGGNGRKSADKHDVSPAEAEQVFVNRPLLLLDDTKHSGAERRYHAYGKTHDGRLLQVSFTLRQNETFVRVISTRPMSARERARYAEEKDDDQV